MLVQIASKFDSSVYVDQAEKRTNAKSIMGVMGLGLDVGKLAVIEANGEDEADAIVAIEQFLTK